MRNKVLIILRDSCRLFSRQRGWYYWPFPLFLCLLGYILFEAPPTFDRSKGSGLGAVASVEQAVKNSVKRDFVGYLSTLVPRLANEKWGYRIDVMPSILKKGGDTYEVVDVKVDVLVTARNPPYRLTERVEAHLLRSARQDRYAEWLGKNSPKMKIRVFVKEKSIWPTNRNLYWLTLFVGAVGLLVLVLKDIWSLSRKPSSRKHVFQDKKDLSKGTVHINEMSYLQPELMNKTILNMPVSQVYELLRNMPKDQRASFVEQLHVSQSIKKHLLHKI